MMAYFPLVLSLVIFLCFASPSSSDFSPAEPLLQPDVDGLSVSAPSPPATTGGSSVSVVVGSGGDRGDQRAAGRALESFPAVVNSTVMFLHVFKCAGTTLREVLITWANREGWNGAEVAYCSKMALLNSGHICLNDKNDLADPLEELSLVKDTKVFAGHFLWDFRHYVTAPYLMLTMLRNPLELFVSSQQYMHKAETRTLNESVAFVSGSMRSRISRRNPTDIAFVRRFLDSEIADTYDPRKVYPDQEMMDWTESAVDHLNTFYVVGVVEQYQGFIEVLKRLFDSDGEHPELWKAAVSVKNNGAPVHSGEVLRGIDPDLIRDFNSSTLSMQWQVYSAALQLWDQRCREVLPVEDHLDLCSVSMNRL
ncbi:unnamed protein product [Pylaiella littoralis]